MIGELTGKTPEPKRRGRRPAAPPSVGPPGERHPSKGTPDWRFHHLTLSGPSADAIDFAAAARGPGIVPWHLDLAGIEEDVFNLAVGSAITQRSLTVDGCRILARQFRQRVAARQQRAAALLGSSRACPLDFQTLLPVPEAVLQRGPTDPRALLWLSENWGMTDSPRHVRQCENPSIGRRLPAGHQTIGYSFFTRGETPHAAITHLAARWPSLAFRLQPQPLD